MRGFSIFKCDILLFFLGKALLLIQAVHYLDEPSSFIVFKQQLVSVRFGERLNEHALVKGIYDIIRTGRLKCAVRLLFQRNKDAARGFVGAVRLFFIPMNGSIPILEKQSHSDGLSGFIMAHFCQHVGVKAEIPALSQRRI